jgi:hypothetical protein
MNGVSVVNDRGPAPKVIGAVMLITSSMQFA